MLRGCLRIPDQTTASQQSDRLLELIGHELERLLLLLKHQGLSQQRRRHPLATENSVFVSSILRISFHHLLLELLEYMLLA